MAEYTEVKLRAAFIQIVQPQCDMLTSLTGTAEENAQWWDTHNIFLVENYVDAALLACKQGLLSKDGLKKVCNAGRVDFQRMMARQPEDFDWLGKSPWEAMNRSLAIAACELDEQVERIRVP